MSLVWTYLTYLVTLDLCAGSGMSSAGMLN